MITLMASISMMPIIFLYLSCQILPSLASQSSHIGLTLELIPPYSPKSPLYNGNLTFAERRQRLMQQSRARAQYLSAILSASTSSNGSDPLQPDMITPRVEPLRVPKSAMAVSVGIGTFNGAGPSTRASYKSYLLLLDTGCDITWIQCEECKLEGNKCYPQKDEPYPNTKSISFFRLRCKENEFCEYNNQCDANGDCVYTLGYLDGDGSSGILANETFTFPSSSSSRSEAIQKIVFGCGLINRYAKAEQVKDFPLSGVFGLGQGRLSFVKQIEQRIDGRFSYCLVGEGDHPPTTYLRFGSDIKPTRNLKTTGFYEIEQDSSYYVTLKNLGVNGVPLDIDPSVFAPSGKAGQCMVDTGFSWSVIVKDAYDMLVKQLDAYFSKHAEFTRDTSIVKDSLCYKRNKAQGYTNIPSVNFYFEGAQLDVIPERTFERAVISGKEVFCLMMVSDNEHTTLGAYQQVNIKFIYDIKSKKLHFGPEDCAKNN